MSYESYIVVQGYDGEANMCGLVNARVRRSILRAY